MPALIFDAELTNVLDVRARLAVRADQHLTDLHDAIQEAFGWLDDHLYSFWLDGRFWGDAEREYTSPVTPDESEQTADVPLAELDLAVGQEIAYVFDFGDEWRVRLPCASRPNPTPPNIRGSCSARAPRRRSTRTTVRSPEAHGRAGHQGRAARGT
jgi:hypothetical protein